MPIFAAYGFADFELLAAMAFSSLTHGRPNPADGFLNIVFNWYFNLLFANMFSNPDLEALMFIDDVLTQVTDQASTPLEESAAKIHQAVTRVRSLPPVFGQWRALASPSFPMGLLEGWRRMAETMYGEFHAWRPAGLDGNLWCWELWFPLDLPLWTNFTGTALPWDGEEGAWYVPPPTAGYFGSPNSLYKYLTGTSSVYGARPFVGLRHNMNTEWVMTSSRYLMGRVQVHVAY
jgi:hypothetical protein